ncbi:MAG: hypothetical protein LUD50_00080 [Clostridia bacterium]|nr:hypothetical protein [Clostridia bacterium]
MSRKKVVVKKKGFSVVSLIIGLLIGIIIAVAAVGGVIAYLVFGDIDSIFSILGVDNGEEGNYTYVNTDEVSSVYDLISWFTGLDSFGELTVGDICERLPVVETYVDTVFDVVSEYGISLSKSDVYTWPFNQFQDKLSDVMMDIEIGAFLDTVGVSGTFTENVIVKAMLYGIEAKYVYTDAGGKYPVWYDEYYLWDSETDEDVTTDYNITDAADLSLGSDSHLWLKNKTNDRILMADDYAYLPYMTLNSDHYYRLYFYGSPDIEKENEDDETYQVKRKDEDGNLIEYTYYVTERDDTGSFVEIPDGLNEPLEYKTDSAVLHGNWYFDSAGHEVDANLLTIRKLTDNPYENLYEIYITDLYEGNTEELSFLADVLGDVSLAELINGEVDFAEIVDNLELSSLMSTSINTETVNSADTILLYLLYGISSVEPIEGMSNTYTGLYRTIVYDEETSGYVNGEEVTCYIKTDDSGKIEGVYIYDSDAGEYVEASGTTINQVNTRMNGIMDDLTIAEIVDTDEINNPLVDMIAGSTINGFANDINHMTMNQLFCNDIYGVDDGESNLVATMYDVVAPDTDPTEENQMAFNSEYTYYIKPAGSAILVPVGEGYSVDPDTGEVTPGNGHYDSWEALSNDTNLSDEDEIVTYGEARALWKLLIYKTVTVEDASSGEGGNGQQDNGSGETTKTTVQYEIAYQVGDMNNMYYNIQQNVQNANMATLKEAMMLDISDDFLDSYLYTVSGTTVSQSDQKVGDMTLIELLDYIQTNLTYTSTP